MKSEIKLTGTESQVNVMSYTNTVSADLLKVHEASKLEFK